MQEEAGRDSSEPLVCPVQLWLWLPMQYSISLPRLGSSQQYQHRASGSMRPHKAMAGSKCVRLWKQALPPLLPTPDITAGKSASSGPNPCPEGPGDSVSQHTRPQGYAGPLHLHLPPHLCSQPGAEWFTYRLWQSSPHKGGCRCVEPKDFTTLGTL